MWQAIRLTRPIPTPSATTCPTWEPLRETRRSTAMRSAWRRAMVRDVSHVRLRPVVPPAHCWRQPIKKQNKNRNFNEEVSSNWTTALEKWPVRLSVHVTPLDEQIGLFEASLHNHAEETGQHIFFARCCFLNFHPSSGSFLITKHLLVFRSMLHIFCWSDNEERLFPVPVFSPEHHPHGVCVSGVFAGVPVSSRVSAKIQQLVNTLKQPRRPPLREFFVDDFDELLEG